jgi:hypothetical protein
MVALIIFYAQRRFGRNKSVLYLFIRKGGLDETKSFYVYLLQGRRCRTGTSFLWCFITWSSCGEFINLYLVMSIQVGNWFDIVFICVINSNVTLEIMISKVVTTTTVSELGGIGQRWRVGEMKLINSLAAVYSYLIHIFALSSLFFVIVSWKSVALQVFCACKKKDKRHYEKWG